MEFLIFLAILAVVVVFVTRPLWRPPDRPEHAEQASHGSSEIADLEAAREAKFREIRDAELDHRTGKLSAEDFELIDRSLRAEALEILRALDRAGGRPGHTHNGHLPVSNDAQEEDVTASAAARQAADED